MARHLKRELNLNAENLYGDQPPKAKKGNVITNVNFNAGEVISLAA